MRSLFQELDEVGHVSAAGRQSTARSWCDPSLYHEVVGLDFGCNSVHWYMARSGRSGKLSFTELFGWLERLSKGTLVVCESAHLGVPQTELSLAQPFTAQQLLCLYRALESRGIALKLAPHAHTGNRMRLWVSYCFPNLIRDSKKSDAADAVAIAVYVDRCNGISLASPCMAFHQSLRRQYGRKVTSISNRTLNAARTDSYHGQFYPLIVKLGRAMVRGGGCINHKFAVSVASTLVSERDGELVLFTHRGQIPGRWFWMRDVLRMSPWHHRGGIARSNIMWHAFKPYAANYCRRRGAIIKNGAKYKKVALLSDKERACRTAALKSLREVLLRARDLCLLHAQKMGAGTLELTDCEQEATDGTHS